MDLLVTWAMKPTMEKITNPANMLVQDLMQQTMIESLQRGGGGSGRVGLVEGEPAGSGCGVTRRTRVCGSYWSAHRQPPAQGQN